MAFDWYPFNPTEFRRDTYHLGAAADGIYRRLLDEYYITGLPLPDNDQALAAIARIGLDEWHQHAEVVRAFFKSKDGKLIHKRCERELHARSMLAASRSRKAKEAAAVRWMKDKQKHGLECYGHAGSNAKAMLNDATLHNTKNITSSEYAAAREPVDNSRVVPSRESEGCPTKRPTEASRSDLEAIFQRKRSAG